MNTLKGWLTTGVLMTLLVLGTTTANAGVIFGVKADGGTCTIVTDDKTDYGVIFGFTGVIFGFTGVIFGVADTSTCGK